MSIPEKLRQAYHNDLTDVPLLIDAADEIDRVRAALASAIRAAELALFVIHKQGVMPNSSWGAGFESDMKVARDALGGQAMMINEWQHLADEIERLTAQLHDYYQARVIPAETRVVELEARWCKALKTIAERDETIERLTAERNKLEDMWRERPTGTRAQRERQLTKRLEAAEAELARLKAEAK